MTSPLVACPEQHTHNLPLPAVKLAQRLAQLARQDTLIIVEVVVVEGDWYLRVNGRNERLGREAT